MQPNDPFAPHVAVLWTYIWPVLALLGVIVVLRLIFKLTRKTRAEKRHAWNQKRSWADLKRIREIGPIANPGRVFSWLRKVDPYRFSPLAAGAPRLAPTPLPPSRRETVEGAAL